MVPHLFLCSNYGPLIIGCMIKKRGPPQVPPVNSRLKYAILKEAVGVDDYDFCLRSEHVAHKHSLSSDSKVCLRRRRKGLSVC